MCQIGAVLLRFGPSETTKRYSTCPGHQQHPGLYLENAMATRKPSPSGARFDSSHGQVATHAIVLD
jgi:hypothetical protein